MYLKVKVDFKGVGRSGSIKMGPFLHTTKLLFCLICSPICLLYHVIKNFVQKALFPEILAVISGWGVTMYDKET